MDECAATPWDVKFGEALTVIDRHGMRVAHITHIGPHGRRSPKETATNARWIAAAPELLEALKESQREIIEFRNDVWDSMRIPDGDGGTKLDCVESGSEIMRLDRVIEQNRKAIAKAEDSPCE